jgi:hypothetical protein
MTCEEARTAIAAGEDPAHEGAACATWRAARDDLSAALAARPSVSPAPGFEGRLLERAAERPRRPRWPIAAGLGAALAVTVLVAMGTRHTRRPPQGRPAVSAVPAPPDVAPFSDGDRTLARTIAAYDDLANDLAVSADWARATAPLAGLDAVVEGALR